MKGLIVEVVNVISGHKKVYSSFHTTIQVTSFLEYSFECPNTTSLVDQQSLNPRNGSSRDGGFSSFDWVQSLMGKSSFYLTLNFEKKKKLSIHRNYPNLVKD